MKSGFRLLVALSRIAVFACLTAVPVAVLSQGQTEADVQEPRATQPGPPFEQVDSTNADLTIVPPRTVRPHRRRVPRYRNTGLTIVPPRTVPYTDGEYANLADTEKIRVYQDEPNLLPADFSPERYRDLLHPR